jgi:WD40 repeat protein
VTDAELRHRLRRDPVPGESEAGQRAWEVVRASYAARERVPWIERHSRLVVVLAGLAAIAVAAVTPPGQAVVDRVREGVAGRSPSEPALVRLPAPGGLLVVSETGPWVVNEDGSKRLLGDYEDASWSPRGRFVVATREHQLVTLEPESGDVRWSLSRSDQIRDARWSGGGLDTRIAYRSGSSLHVVAGDGSPDIVLAPDVAPVAPAWKDDSHVLSYAGADGRAHVVDVDARRELWRTPKILDIRRLSFSPDGSLVVLTRRNAGLYRPRGLIRLAAEALPKGDVLVDAVALPGAWVLYADYDPKKDATELVIAQCFAPGPCILIGPSEVFRGAGRIGNLTLSPDGRWLAAAWPAADQILFFRVLRFNRVVPVSNVTREFQPGANGQGFPRLAGWAPPAP